jgi:hypothetical protein
MGARDESLASLRHGSDYVALIRTVAPFAYNPLSIPVKSSIEKTLVDVWRQVLVENAKVVELGTDRYSVQRTSRHCLRQVDFVLDDSKIRGLEQNPETKSQWAQPFRQESDAVFSEGRYIANVVDGKVTLYGKRAGAGH